MQRSIISAVKRDEVLTHVTTTCWEKPGTKGHMPYGPLSVKCPEQASPQGQKAEDWLWGRREGTMEGLLKGVRFFLEMTMFQNRL